MKRVIIVGGGLAGLSCAQKLADKKDVQVTLLDRSNYYHFKPLLYKVATLELDLNDVSTSLQSLFSGKSNVDVQHVEVVSVDPEKKMVETKEGQKLSGDIIVLACGSQPNFFGIPGAAEYSYPLYTFEDARRIQCQILSVFERAEKDPSLIEKGLLNFVIVGAGPTGTEFAGGIAEIIFDGLQHKFSDILVQQAAVYLVDILPEVLMPFSKKSRLYAEKELEKRQVRLRLNVAVKEIHPDHLLLSDGSTIATETVIWAGGVMAAPLMAHCGLTLGKGGRIEVASDLSVRGYPCIYALGDCANISGNDGSFLPQLSTVAQQSGRVAAANIMRSIDGKSTRAFHYVDRGITAIIGHRCVVANLGKRRFAVTGFLASMVWLFIHAPFIPTFRQRMKTIFKWVWQYFSK